MVVKSGTRKDTFGIIEHFKINKVPSQKGHSLPKQSPV
jgi:hypothetical protein